MIESSIDGSELVSVELPKILLVTDASLSAKGGGINRTLLNLFDQYPYERIMLFSSIKTIHQHPTIPSIRKQTISFDPEFIPCLSNRFGKIINPILQIINFEILKINLLKYIQNIKRFKPQLLIICPNSIQFILIGYHLSNQVDCPVLIYAMDDWIGAEHVRWISGSAKQVIYKLLRKSSAWLLISEQLKNSFSSHYKLMPKHSMIVNNPIDLSDKKMPEIKTFYQGTFKIIYAGSIWPMHYDALATFAQAVFELRQEGKSIELILHTQESFWSSYKEKWHYWQVSYGNLIPYDRLNQCLQSANLLLVVSSFMPDYSFLTRSSFQTKLTDYMASGRPILSVGPDYSVCNQFLKKWNCGWVCEMNQVNEIKKTLVNIIKHQSKSNDLARRAFALVHENFEKKQVQAKLYSFINYVVHNSI